MIKKQQPQAQNSPKASYKQQLALGLTTINLVWTNAPTA
jgi:hypothetical protein